MKTHPDLASVLAALDAHGEPLAGGPGTKASDRTVVARFDFDGATWNVHADAKVRRLHELAEFIERGGDPHRRTDAGRRALGTGGDVDGCFVYETQRKGNRHLRGSSSDAGFPTASCPSCFIDTPVGSECGGCGWLAVDG